MSNLIRHINLGILSMLSSVTNIFSPKNNSLETILTALMKKHSIAGVGYALINDFEVADAVTISQDKQINAGTSLFQACSLSKTLAAFAILKLASDNLIDLDSPIATQLKGWKLPANDFPIPVTVRQCLSMTSGLTFGEIGKSFLGYPQGTPVPTLNEILQGLPPATNDAIKISDEPGSHYYYSGAGFMVLQQLIQDVSGLSYNKFIKDKILKPLQMEVSTVQCPLPSSMTQNVVLPSNSQISAEISWDNIPAAASGGLWSTPAEIAKLVLAISKAYLGKDNRLVKQSYAKEMLSTQSNSIFGLGLIIDGDDKNLNFRKNGHNSRYHDELIMFPNTGQGIVIMTDSPLGINLINDFIEQVSRLYQWPTFSPDFNELVTKPTHTNQLKQ
jgi:CubicO group peptidase (beta-lactamase class C family)